MFKHHTSVNCTTLLLFFRNIAGPEGVVVLSHGTMIIAEQRTNRILALHSRAHPCEPAYGQAADISQPGLH